MFDDLRASQRDVSAESVRWTPSAIIRRAPTVRHVPLQQRWGRGCDAVTELPSRKTTCCHRTDTSDARGLGLRLVSQGCHKGTRREIAGKCEVGFKFPAPGFAMPSLRTQPIPETATHIL
jgi:hypothetical protein